MPNKTLLFECEMSPLSLYVGQSQIMVAIEEGCDSYRRWNIRGVTGGWALRFYIPALLPACLLLPD